MNPFLDGPRTVLDLAGIRAFNDGVERARREYAENPLAGDSCGTKYGRELHNKRNEPVCDECTEAARAYERARYARNKEKAK